MKIVFTQIARADVLDATAWYDEQKSGLGERFDLELQSTLRRIVENPRLYAVRRKQVRKAPVRRFPFTVLYRLEADTIAIYACFHNSRDPRAWRDRI